MIKRNFLMLFLGFFWLAASAQTSGPGLTGRVLLGDSDFDSGQAQEWSPNVPAHWRVVNRDGGNVYELTAPGEPGKVRAPTSWSLWTGRDVDSFEFVGRMRCYTDPSNLQRDMCILFHYQDPTHFYYVHFAGSSDEVHNIIGLVNGRDRVKINFESSGQSSARLRDRAWHRFKVTFDALTGAIEAFLDDMDLPILTAYDRTIGRGLVGIGSFDDTGCFDDLKLWRLSE